MPVLDGYAATRQIRSLPGGEQVKILALTANAFEEDRKKILDAGCDDMVRKPVEENQVFSVMGAWLGLHYRYEKAQASAQVQVPREDIDLSVLPGEVVQRLRAAAQSLDMEAVQEMVRSLYPEYPHIAETLEAWVQAFRFDRITTLCSAQQKDKQP
jgi:CheY-like chemotaxis protein